MDVMEKMASPASAVPPVLPAIPAAKPSWFLDWTGETVALIASGSSAAKAGVEQLQGRVRTMVVNTSWQLAPWADVLYGCDLKWWEKYNGVPEFKGLKLVQEREARTFFPELHLVKVDRLVDQLLLDRPGYVGSGGNGGFQVLNLAVQFGAKKILLIGYDMKGDHWHARHPFPLSNPHPQDNFPRWRRAIDGAALVMWRMGITIINCSMISALQAYPKKTIQEALR
jgi:hypothetical protein